jgi:hypothetical protein
MSSSGCSLSGRRWSKRSGRDGRLRQGCCLIRHPAFPGIGDTRGQEYTLACDDRFAAVLLARREIPLRLRSTADAASKTVSNRHRRGCNTHLDPMLNSAQPHCLNTVPENGAGHSGLTPNTADCVSYAIDDVSIAHSFLLRVTLQQHESQSWGNLELGGKIKGVAGQL